MRDGGAVDEFVCAFDEFWGGLEEDPTDEFGLKLFNLFGQELEVASGGEGEDTEAVGVLANDVERIGSDGTGGTENREVA